MRKSIALLLGLSLATLTACEQAPGNSGAASSDAASAVISEAASDAAPATAETPAVSSRDTTTEQRNVLDGFVDFSADTAGGSLKCARAAAVLVEYLSCADIDASTAADWMTDLTQDQRDLLDINWAGILANAQNIAADPASQTDLLSCAGVTTDFTGMVLTGVPDKLVILNTVFTGKAG